MEWTTIGLIGLILFFVFVFVEAILKNKEKVNEDIQPGDPRWKSMGFVRVPEALRGDILEVKYPCKPCEKECDSLCDKIEMDSDTLLKRILLERCCPDCGCEYICGGPRGGMSINVMCADCKHTFNFCLPFFVERI